MARAKLFAIQIHSGHFRKASKDMYVHHLFRIEGFLTKHFNHLKNIEELKIAAILHDAIEDTWVTKDIIKQKFSKKVADLVDSLSKLHSHKSYLEILKESTDEVKLIKLIDIYDNIYDGFEGPKWPLFIKDSKEIILALNVSNKEFKKEFDQIKKEALQKIELELSR